MLPLKDIMSEIRGSIFPIFLYSLLFVFPQSLLEMDATSFPSLVASLSAHHLLRLLLKWSTKNHHLKELMYKVLSTVADKW